MAARIRAWKWDLLIGAGFLLLPLLLYGSVTVGSRTMLPADNLFQWAPWQPAAGQFDASVPHNALIGDLIIQNYAWKRFVLTSIAGGEIPLWNPYLFAGAPFLANGQHSALYPFSVLYLILPLEKAFGWFTLSQMWLAGVLMYIYGRVVGMRRGSAALAGLVFQGGGFLIAAAAVFPMILGAVVWLPLLLACIEKIVRTALEPSGRNTTLLWAGLGAVALGSQVLAGHAEFTYYTLLIMGLYAVWRLITTAAAREHAGNTTAAQRLRQLWRPALWLAGMVVIGLLLAAVQLAPLYEVGQVNFRAGSASFEEVLGWAFPWRNLITLLVPNFYGNPTHHAYRDVFSGENVALVNNAFGLLNPHGPYTSSWGIKNYVEGAFYLGVLPLLLTLIGSLALGRRNAQQSRRALTLFYLGLSLFSIAFIFGTPLYGLLYYGLPFIDQLHTPFRWVFPLSLAVAALAGFGADAVSASRAEKSDDHTGTFARLVDVIGLAAAVAGLFGLGALAAARLYYGRFEPFIERVFLGLAQAADAFPSARAFFSYQFWEWLIFFLLLFGGGLVILLSRRRWWIVVALSLVLVDLYLAGAGFNAAVDPALLAYKPEALAWLESRPGHWRLTTFDPHGAKPLNANTPWLYDLADIRGYDSIIPRQYVDYMSAIESQSGLQFNRVQPIGRLESLNSPMLDALGVQYILTTETLDLPKLILAWEGEGVRIYENAAVAPRAYTLPRSATVVAPEAITGVSAYDPRLHVVVQEGEGPALEGTAPQPGVLRPAAIEQYNNNEVIVSAATTEPAWLVLNDSYFPGWRAYVRPAGSAEDQEQEALIYRINGNFRGVLLEPGEWTVRYRYSPRSFLLGGLGSFMGLAILTFAGLIWGWMRFYRPAGETSYSRSVAKNSAVPMALNLFNKGIDFVFAAYYLRVLGPADAGSFATAIATAGIFEILANYGLNILLIREVSQDRSQAGRYLLNSGILRIGTALVAALPVILYVRITGAGANPLTPAEIAAIGLFMIGMFFSGLALGVSGLFYVYEQAEIPAAMATGTTILKVALGVIVLLAGYSFVGLAAVSIVVNLATLLALGLMAFRRFDLSGPWKLDLELQRSMLRLGFPLMLIHLLQTIFISVDVLLLRQLAPGGEKVVGWYNSAYKWFNALQIIPSFFTLALFPIISKAIKEDMPTARRIYHVALKLMFLLALPTAALITFAAPFMIGVLGGREFLPQGAIALQIIIWSIPFGWLNSVTNYVLIALGLERMQPRAFAVAVGFNVVANWFLIPRYSYVAASVITILSEVVLLVVFSYFLRRRQVEVNWAQFAWRPLLLTGLMLAAMWLVNQFSLLLALLVGAMVYLFGLWALRIIGPDERQALYRILPLSIASRLRLLPG